jgi:hypothetical protein
VFNFFILEKKKNLRPEKVEFSAFHDLNNLKIWSVPNFALKTTNVNKKHQLIPGNGDCHLGSDGASFNQHLSKKY